MEQISEEQRAYIVGHINDRPRTAVAHAAGVSMSTLYRVVRENGGERDYERTRRNPEWERIVRENYAAMAGHEIERRYGITKNRANKIARALGLSHTEETCERLRRENRRLLDANRKKIDQTKRKRRWKALFRMDEIRVWEGKPQRTKFRLRKMTGKAYKAKFHLVQKYGYHGCNGEPYTLLFDTETKRRPVDGCKWGTEMYYAQKYGLLFKAAGKEK